MFYTDNMLFLNNSAEVSIGDVSKYIVSRLQNEQHVLWLVSGGSAISIQVAIMDSLAETVPDQLDKLTILPIDERFGPHGHADSNSEQMRRAGFLPRGANWIDVLSANASFDETLQNYAAVAKSSFAQAKAVVATMGLGPDGHTAGLLPGSAAVEDDSSVVVGYDWSDYKRMTLGLASLRRITNAYVLAYGESKRQALNRLHANQEPLSSLPAKVLYNILSVTVYNDCITSEG
jgi:6-phosphogluconolactonase